MRKYRDNYGRCCAQGHFGRADNMWPRDIDDADALKNLIYLLPRGIISINDGLGSASCYGLTPKQRIINALKEVLEGEMYGDT